MEVSCNIPSRFLCFRVFYKTFLFIFFARMFLPNSILDIFCVFPRAQSSTSTGNLHATTLQNELFYPFDRLHSSKYGSETATITNEVLIKSQFDIITDIRYTHKTLIYESNLEEKQAVENHRVEMREMKKKRSKKCGYSSFVVSRDSTYRRRNSS